MLTLPLTPALTFDDVLLVPSRSEVHPAQVDISSRLVAFSRVRLRMAMDTLGVGTRMALPVSLPLSTGSALAAAVAAPVSVMTGAVADCSAGGLVEL